MMFGVRRRVAAKGIVAGSIAALVVAPLLIVVIQAFAGTIHVIEVFGGALFAVAFFASTAITAMLFQSSAALPKAVLTIYAIKTAIVLAFLYFVSLNDLSKTTLAISIAVSSVTYLVVQTVCIAGRARL